MLMINNYFATQTAENAIANANKETKQAITGIGFQSIFANTLIAGQSISESIGENLGENNLLGKLCTQETSPTPSKGGEQAKTAQMPFGIININLKMGTNIDHNGEIETDIDADNILPSILENIFSEISENINTTAANENTSLPANQITETDSTKKTTPENNPNYIIADINANNYNIATELITANPELANVATELTTASAPSNTNNETSIIDQLQPITGISEKPEKITTNAIIANTSTHTNADINTNTDLSAKSNLDQPEKNNSGLVQKLVDSMDSMDNIVQVNKKQGSINTNKNTNTNTNPALNTNTLNITNNQAVLSFDKSDTLTLDSTEPRVTTEGTEKHSTFTPNATQSTTPSTTIEQNAIAAQLANGVTKTNNTTTINNTNAMITSNSDMAISNSPSSSEQSALNLGDQKQTDAKNSGENNKPDGQNQASNNLDSSSTAQATEKNITAQNNQIFQKYMAQTSTTKGTETRSYSNVTMERFPELTARISRTLLPSGEQNIKMSMSPEGLGTVFVNLNMKDGVLSMTMKSDNESTLKKLEQQLGLLKENIAKQGLKLENIELGKQSLTDSGQQSSGERSSHNAQERRPNRDTIASDNGNITTGSKDDSPNLQEEALPVYKSDNIIEKYI